MATGQNFVPPLPLTQPTACRLFDPPYPPKTDSFARDPLRNHRHLAIAPTRAIRPHAEPSNRPYLRISGQLSAVATTTRMVPTPPVTTEMTGPNNCATRPDSNPPNSFEVPMNRLFTADTRPRISSGVSNCTSVCRTTT